MVVICASWVTKAVSVWGLSVLILQPGDQQLRKVSVLG